MNERLRRPAADFRAWVFALILLLIAFGVSHDVAMGHGVGVQGDSHVAADIGGSESLVHMASVLCAAAVLAGLFLIALRALGRAKDRWRQQIRQSLRFRSGESYTPSAGRHRLYELCVLRA